jgi:hypothetical protein
VSEDTPIAPFPWFGGKRRVAPEVWAALGAVDNYVEPFAGSLAVLLARPDSRWRTGAETVNDKDYYIENFWRALSAAPEEVANWADWPVNEGALLPRHLWLVNEGRKRIASMEADPDFYDAKVAGWWVWGINSWIGGGWCSGQGPWRIVDGRVIDDRTAPSPARDGTGVSSRRPHLGNAGQGVNRQLPHLGNRSNDKPGREESLDDLMSYFRALAARLRRVRVCCGDWERVVTDGALAYGDSVGVFLDPPYDTDVRDSAIYNTDAEHGQISGAVREWALAHGDNPRYRIVLAGYEAEHASQMPDSWRVIAYSAGAAYQHAAGGGANSVNRHNERLWISPHCQGRGHGPLFKEAKA